jgi:hypothetical protein
MHVTCDDAAELNPPVNSEEFDDPNEEVAKSGGMQRIHGKPADGTQI